MELSGKIISHAKKKQNSFKIHLPQKFATPFFKECSQVSSFYFLTVKKKIHKATYLLCRKTLSELRRKIHLMETIFSQILFLSILSIFVLQTNSIEKLYLSNHFQKMKNYLKHNSLLSKANTLITKTKILRYLAGH